MKDEPRIVSLIASSTETLWELGYGRNQVGRSHECDYPSSVEVLPVCSQPKFDIDGSSEAIDTRVLQTLETALSVYRVEVDTLKELAPTLIVTQDQCEVCAVSLRDVENAVCEVLDTKPRIVSLSPNRLSEVEDGIREIGAALDDSVASERLIERMRDGFSAVESAVSKATVRPRVVCVEWISPLMAAGNWVPELVRIAGGEEVIGIEGAHTPRIAMDALVEADPDVIVVMPCGWGLKKTREEMDDAMAGGAWQNLRAVKEGRLFLTDGNQYFNRPGPRLVESAQIMSEILHPDLVKPRFEGSGWERY